MIEKKTYEQLVVDLEEPTCPLFGGSLAYIDIELNLAMLIKLLKIKMEKDQEDRTETTNNPTTES